MFERRAAAHNSFRCCHNITTTDPANTTRHEKRLNQVSQRRPFKDFQKPPQGGFFLVHRGTRGRQRVEASGHDAMEGMDLDLQLVCGGHVDGRGTNALGNPKGEVVRTKKPA
jgi:hypothetical protein